MLMKKWWVVFGIGALSLVGFMIYFFGTSSVNNVAAFSKLLSNQSIKVTFSNPIKNSSIEKGDVLVKDTEGNVIPVIFTVDDDRKTMVIRPEEEGYFLEEGSYVLELSGKITSRLGVPLLGDRRFDFSVLSTLPTIESEEELRDILLAGVEKEKWSISIREDSSEEKSTNDSATSEGDFSETNVQVGGIDEGDIVKTDGKYIYSTSHNEIFITDAAAMKHVSTIKFEGEIYPQEIFIQNDKLVAISEMYGSPTFSEETKAIAKGHVNIKIFDISDKGKPKQIKELGVEGHFRTSRLHDSIMYVIANQYPDVWILREVWSNDDEVIPHYYDSEGDIHKQDLAKIQYVPGSNEKNYMHLIAIDLESEQLDYNIETILGSGDNFYMSHENLYIAADKYNVNNNLSNTQLFKYDVDGLKMNFHSLGEVEGAIINQFAMDEYEGNFRIATTIYSEAEPTNSLYILDENMNTIGELSGLAKDERIYSVRYMGDKAYMVTFKEVDPLFVIDTSEPTKPVVLGELKIPGYSSYLHFYDENHLIGFGYDTKLMQDDRGGSFVQNGGMKISLFDVSDFHNPKEKDSVIIGGNGTHSDVLYDHKALFQHKGRSLYGFPISVFESSGPFDQKFILNGALVYEITPEKGILLKTTIKNDGDKEEYVDWEDTIRRLMYIDDSLYTISNKQIKSYNLEDFSYKNTVELPLGN